LKVLGGRIKNCNHSYEYHFAAGETWKTPKPFTG